MTLLRSFFLSLFLAPLWLGAATLSLQSGGNGQEVGLYVQRSLNEATVARYTVGYVTMEDEFHTTQNYPYLEAVALDKRLFRHWTFGAGMRLLRTDIEAGSQSYDLTALPIRLSAFFHFPIEHKTFVRFDYFVAPDFLMISDDFTGYTGVRMELHTDTGWETLRLFVGGSKINLKPESGSSYEMENDIFFGIRYSF